MTLSDWLNGPMYRDRPEPTVIQRLAELVFINGGLRVGGWGFISGGGPYGRMGLEQHEALELIHLAGVTEGFVLSGSPFSLLSEALDAEIKRVTDAYEHALQVGPTAW